MPSPSQTSGFNVPNYVRTHRHDTTVHDVIRLLIPALYKNQSDTLVAADGDCHHLCKLMAPVRHRWSINDFIGGIRNTVMPSDCSPALGGHGGEPHAFHDLGTRMRWCGRHHALTAFYPRERPGTQFYRRLSEPRGRSESLATRKNPVTTWDRTLNLPVRSQLLYQLSYPCDGAVSSELASHPRDPCSILGVLIRKDNSGLGSVGLKTDCDGLGIGGGIGLWVSMGTCVGSVEVKRDSLADRPIIVIARIRPSRDYCVKFGGRRAFGCRPRSVIFMTLIRQWTPAQSGMDTGLNQLRPFTIKVMKITDRGRQPIPTGGTGLAARQTS
ncbi:hypothetical protein ANN_25845 [Periplaneta americana]|uniref:Uncharacterized protein n=1 Tax=Periplaneta americana TaxID=6978 RepID=A0ABQ8S4P9_PERAM|nr:hypothetical protein ANN_25845 [Periplaneta americana]